MSVWPDRCRMVDRCRGARVCLYHECPHAGKGAALGAEIDVAVANPSPFSAIGDEALVTMGALILELQRMFASRMPDVLRAAENTPGLPASVAISLVSTLIDHTMASFGDDVLIELRRREKKD
jgi:hypothetical protein